MMEKVLLLLRQSAAAQSITGQRSLFVFLEPCGFFRLLGEVYHKDGADDAPPHVR